MSKTKFIVIVLFILSLAGNIVLGFNLYLKNREVELAKQKIQLNESMVNFGNVFIDKVLRSTGEISFDDRLMIENAVRDTKDKDLYDIWQRFVSSQSEEQGREEVKNLLQVIVNKIASTK